MKAFTRTLVVPVLLLVTGAFCWAQQTPQPTQPTAVPVANTVRLVLEGQVISVHDGDTVTLRDESNKKTNIRLQGIDAPELKQQFGAAAQQNLSRLVLGKQVTIYWTKVDKYRRTVGTIMLDGRDVNIEQVKAGVAWHFKKYEDEQSAEDRRTYAEAEQQAKLAGLGLWSDPKSIPPGDWRQAVKAKRWGPPPPVGTIIGNAKSLKYHRPDCAGYRDMAEANRVFFKTVAEAETAGYKRAGNCPAEIQSVAQRREALPPAALSTTPTAAKPEVAAAPTISPVLMPPDNREIRFGNWQDAIIGNKNSRVYHLPGCEGYSKVAEQNQVKFKSAEEAEQAGYKLAGNCTAKDSSSTTTKVETTTPAEPAAATETVAQSVTAPVTGPISELIIGNKNSKIYHLPGCAGYSRVSEKNQVKFASAKEAEDAGYKLAGNCSAKVEVTTEATPVQTAAPLVSSPTTAPATPVEPAPSPAESPAMIIGNKNSKIYHLPGCAGYSKVSEQNQVKFATAEEAEKAGFRIAKNCSPPKN